VTVPCPVCTCPVVSEREYNEGITRLVNPSYSQMSGATAESIQLAGFMCTGCGIRFKFPPPDLETLLVRGVMEC